MLFPPEVWNEICSYLLGIELLSLWMIGDSALRQRLEYGISRLALGGSIHRIPVLVAVSCPFIKLFRNVKILSCETNVKIGELLANFPRLVSLTTSENWSGICDFAPPTLETLECKDSNWKLDFTPIEKLPRGLTSLKMTTTFEPPFPFAKLPRGLQKLDLRCHLARLTDLEDLPPQLEWFHLGSNQILPGTGKAILLPASLTHCSLPAAELSNNTLPLAHLIKLQTYQSAFGVSTIEEAAQLSRGLTALIAPVHPNVYLHLPPKLTELMAYAASHWSSGWNHDVIPMTAEQVQKLPRSIVRLSLYHGVSTPLEQVDDAFYANLPPHLEHLHLELRYRGTCQHLPPSGDAVGDEEGTSGDLKDAAVDGEDVLRGRGEGGNTVDRKKQDSGRVAWFDRLTYFGLSSLRLTAANARQLPPKLTSLTVDMAHSEAIPHLPRTLQRFISPNSPREEQDSSYTIPQNHLAFPPRLRHLSWAQLALFDDANFQTLPQTLEEVHFPRTTRLSPACLVHHLPGLSPHCFVNLHLRNCYTLLHRASKHSTFVAMSISDVEVPLLPPGLKWLGAHPRKLYDPSTAALSLTSTSIPLLPRTLTHLDLSDNTAELKLDEIQVQTFPPSLVFLALGESTIMPLRFARFLPRQLQHLETGSNIKFQTDDIPDLPSNLHTLIVDNMFVVAKDDSLLLKLPISLTKARFNGSHLVELNPVERQENETAWLNRVRALVLHSGLFESIE